MGTMRYALAHDMHRRRPPSQRRQDAQGDVRQALREGSEVRGSAGNQDSQPRKAAGRTILVARDQGARVLALAGCVESRNGIRALDRSGGRAVHHQGRAPMGVYPDVRSTSGWDGPGPSLPHPALYSAGSSRGRYQAREHAPVSYRCGRRERAKDRVRQRPQVRGGQRVPTS